jgi:hypothetical protein
MSTQPSNFFTRTTSKVNISRKRWKIY